MNILVASVPRPRSRPRADYDPEVATPVRLTPLVKYDLTDAAAAGLVHECQVEAVGLVIPAAVPTPKPGLGCLIPCRHVIGIMAAPGKLDCVRTIKHLSERSRVLVDGEGAEHDG